MKIVNSNIKLIIFDFDNTLVETSEIIQNSLYETFIKYSNQNALALLEKYRNRALQDYFPIVFGHKWQEAAKYFYSQYQMNTDKIAIIDNAPYILNFLKKQQIACVLLSNKSEFLLSKDIDNLGWNHFFKLIVGTKENFPFKPDSATVDFITHELDIENRQEILFVGDSNVDMLCAKNSGCISVFFDRSNNRHQMSNLFPDYKIRSLAELEELCSRI